jgi:hypothetical protein
MYLYNFLVCLRWRYLLGPAGRPISMLTLFRYLLASRAASNVLPARAGELLRIYLPRARDGVAAVTGAASLFIERFFDAFALAAMSAPLLFLLQAPLWVRSGLLLLVAGSVVGLTAALVISFRGKRQGTSVVDRIAASAASLRRPASLFAVLGLTAACAAGDLGVVLTSLAAVRLPATFVAGVMCLLGINLGNLFQVTPANVGPLEAAAMLALAALGIRGPQALAFAILYHLVWVVPLTLTGLEGLRLVGEARREQRQ